MKTISTVSPGSPLANTFAQLCAEADAAARPLPDLYDFLAHNSSARLPDVVDTVCVDQKFRCRTQDQRKVEEYLERIPAITDHVELKVHLIVHEFALAKRQRRHATVSDLFERFPEVHELVIERLKESGFAADLHAEFEVTKVVDTAAAAAEPAKFQDRDAGGADHPPLPKRIGRYRVIRLLGSGGFGRVYLGYDELLKRRVAIKVPKDDLVLTVAARDRFLSEARILASLEDSSGVVPVFDVGMTRDGLAYVVSKYIDGSDLSAVSQTELSVTRCVEIVAEVAEALHAAHEQHIIHRDVKPANILLDRSGKASVADFGIALQEDDAVDATRVVGTVSYSSPEQSRGEGHLVDSRSDIFSLGVVFYELLTGARPYENDRFFEARDFEVVPPRQNNPDVTPEVERICLKAIALRAANRYATAKEMADELRDCLADCDSAGAIRPARLTDTSPRILPKGLRCFDYEDADFFLELLPGPRGRDGLPDVLRYWKRRIEGDGTFFRVGLIYGPSGCGKSSLLRAGLIPRLHRSIHVEYVACAADTTEAILLRRLRRAYAEVPQDLDLPNTVASIRRRLHSDGGLKLLIVLDQFEQWLQHHRPGEVSELINALRQCDGSHVQCLISIRDDFWTRTSDFFRELEVELSDSDNLKCVDLFSQHHARKILTEFGRALGLLPADAQPLGDEQTEFIDRVISDLSENDTIAPARIALFVEMMKESEWNSTNLHVAGGTVGIGVTFLEKSFGPSTLHGKYRHHARAVLQELLPKGSTEIRGDARSRDDLFQASGFAGHPAEFQTLLDTLDSELRLITPAETLNDDVEESPGPSAYQLTHDFFVPAIRDWLALGRKQTRQELAELWLAERAAWWSVRPEASSLPTAREWLSIEAFARRSEKRKDSRREGMLKAARRHFFKVGVAIVFAAMVLVGLAWAQQRAASADALVAALRTARTPDAMEIAESLTPYRRWADPRLWEVVTDPQSDELHRFHARLALLPAHRRVAPIVAQSMLELTPARISSADFVKSRDWLAQYSSGTDALAVVKVLNAALREDDREDVRFHAAVALAAFQTSKTQTDELISPEAASLIARCMVDDAAKNPENTTIWSAALWPIRDTLLEPLEEIFRRQQVSPEMAALFLSKYVSDGANLVDLLLEAGPAQQTIMLPVLKQYRDQGLSRLTAIVDSRDSPASTQEDDLAYLRRRARAAALLCELGRSDHLLGMLDNERDPTEATYLVEFLSRQPGSVPVLIDRLQSTKSPMAIALILHAIGETDRTQLAPASQSQCVDVMLQIFATHPAAGVHSSASWALRKWDETEPTALASMPIGETGADGRGWYRTQDGRTMVVFRAPIVARLGSADDAGRRRHFERLIERRIGRTFAVSATETTNREFAEFMNELVQLGRTQCDWADADESGWDDCPVGLINWHWAARYCVWLSEKEGIPPEQWCYRPRNETSNEMVPYHNYLHRTGYRLLTEAEWEFACRAGSATPFSWGADAESADAFAWSYRNSRDRTRPVGTKRPNPFGLFDMHGNASEWLHDSFDMRPLGPKVPNLFELPDDAESEVRADDAKKPKLIKGGSIADTSLDPLRSAYRWAEHPGTDAALHRGFRVARTLSYPDADVAAATVP